MLDFRALFTAEGLVSLVSLAVMEIVLGIDNILLVAILPRRWRPSTGRGCAGWGSGWRWSCASALLFGLSWLMGLTKPLFTVLGDAMSGRDLVLLAGGLFLIYKATHELYEQIEHRPRRERRERRASAAGAGSVGTRHSRSWRSTSCSRWTR